MGAEGGIVNEGASKIDGYGTGGNVDTSHVTVRPLLVDGELVYLAQVV